MKGEQVVNERSHHTRHRAAAVLIAVALGALGAACGDSGKAVSSDTTSQTVQDATQNAKNDAQNAFSALRTEAERMVDQFQTRDAPQAKQKLLDQCRDALERLRKANSNQADSVDSLCNRIRDTDPTNISAWRDVKDAVNKLSVS